MIDRNVPITDIDLSVRSTNALRRANIFTVGNLLAQTEESLSQIRNLGQKSVDEILSIIKLIQEGNYSLKPAEQKMDDSQSKPYDGPVIIGAKASVTELGLSVRSSNALRRAGIFTAEELMGQSEESLQQINNLGKKSIDEIMEVINLLRKNESQGSTDVPNGIEMIEDYESWLSTSDGQETVRRFLKETGKRILDLDLLSNRAYNSLLFNGYDGLDEVIFLTKEQLLMLSYMNETLADEVLKNCRQYLEEKKNVILGWINVKGGMIRRAETEPKNIQDLMPSLDYQGAILKYVRANDRRIEDMPLSKRAKGRLFANGYLYLSDIVLMTKTQLLNLPSLGEKVADEIIAEINAYLAENEKRMIADCREDVSPPLDDEDVREMILSLYKKKPFGGFSLNEFTEALMLPDDFPQGRLKRIIGGLLAAGELEYVDYRCYRVYRRFSEYLETCSMIDERSRDMIRGRIQGKTLEELAQKYNVQRERVRQIVNRDIRKVLSRYYSKTGIHEFDEDYYRYFYQNYSFDKKDAENWFGITPEVWNYLDLTNAEKGQGTLRSALEDKNLDAGLRLKIKNYINRNKVYIDGMWVDKKRADLEELVVRKFCGEDVTFEQFVEVYNDFLAQEEIEYDESLYYTEGVLRSRKARLADSRFLLWKQNERLRAYDIDGRDYTELLDTINLESYENTALSTQKFMEMFPEIMDRYDIRDHYELHNLLRKIVKEGSYHALSFGKMPMIHFGTFDRDAAIFELLTDNAPISQMDFCQLIHEVFGYDHAVIAATYLQPFSVYYHQGIYSIDQKRMSEERKQSLQAVLTESFYYIDEIRKQYGEMFPDADIEEINPFNLKSMGFQVFSRYVLQHYTTLEAYLRDILTREDIVDISVLRGRLGSVQAYYSTLLDLKKNLSVVEFEPDKLIQFRKLEQSGMTAEMVREYCDAVWDFVEEGEYFSIQSLKQDGFLSELFDWGFSDWFYGSILQSDHRFSYMHAFRCLVFVKGTATVTIRSFELDRIEAYGSIDAYDLMDEMTERFGCRISSKAEVLEKIRGTKVYYDSILDRLYANANLYYRELDVMGGD